MNPALPDDIQLLKEYIIVVYAKRMIENKAVEINESDLPNKELILQDYIEAFKRAHNDHLDTNAVIMRAGFERPYVTREENKVIISYVCRGHEGTLTLPLKGLLYLANKRMNGYLRIVSGYS